ncbi:hypothetical protein [Nostoc sp.]|uniref:hypothetical protein n=1 Tax=Nostoc sp. TaxID=1180 RepID=UPI002FF9EDB5
MGNVQYGLRTFSRFGVSRYATIDTETVKIPMPIITTPGTLGIKLNENLQKLKGKNCQGQTVTELAYIDGLDPEISIVCAEAAPEFDTFIHGRLLESATSYVDGFTYFELDATKTTFPARVAGEYGYSVTAQTAEPNTEIYYIDPVTKLSKVISIVAADPADDEMMIGQHLAITLSAELATTGAKIEGWVPCPIPVATLITAKLLGLVEIKAMGVDFNNKVAGFRARYCSRIPGGDINEKPERQANFNITPDANDGTGLGFQMFYANLDVVC